MITLDVKNMSCQHCVKSVTGAIQALDAAAKVQVDLQTGKVQVDTRAATDAVVGAVSEAGYPAALAKGPAPAPAAKSCGAGCGCGS